METIALLKPFKLQDGNEITELSIQFDELSVADFRQISKLESMISDNKTVDASNMTRPKPLSFEFHLASGFTAAIKGTKGLKIEDFTKLPMTDAMKLAESARFFWLGVD